ncbi:hypothetical protein SLS53_000280 [Cytospora paraplurivora]|uniref:Uncharacterized protein n=1 Tax=Cytospora paraplurivora TaxID=2898453 RepID=A0AAN9UMG0_9PEZI
MSPAKMLIADWQLALNYHSPADIGGMLGLGQPLQGTAWPSVSYTDVDGDITLGAQVNVVNYLYAVGDFERLAHETKNASASLHNGTTSYARVVKAVGLKLKYQIVYIPVMLLVGSVCVSAAALITSGLLMADIVRGTASVRMWQQVGTVQLLADEMKGLLDDPIFEELYQSRKTGAERIARHYKVRLKVLGRRLRKAA